MRTITVRVDEELLARVNAAAGRVPRERWIRDRLREALDVLERPVAEAPAAKPKPPTSSGAGRRAPTVAQTWARDR